MKRKPNKPQDSSEMFRAIMLWDLGVFTSVLYGIMGNNNNIKIVVFAALAIYTAFLILKIKRWYDQM